MRTTIKTLAVLMMFVGLSPALQADDLAVDWWTVDGGGIMWSTGGDFELGGTTGQPDAGVSTGGDFTLTGGFWPAGAAAPTIKTGDVNCDGEVNIHDINPFALLLANPAAWQTAFPGCPMLNGDINGDGEVNIHDINPFVVLLSTSG
jgi:hypothetical protein